MVKFRAKGKNSRQLYGFGLSEENVRRLKEGKPIFFAGEDVGLADSDLFIFYGVDEASMEKDLAQYMSQDTVVIDQDAP